MLKNNRKRIILTSLVILLPLLAGLVLWDRLPESVAIHFGPDGQPDGWSGRAFAVFFIPLFILAAHLLAVFITCSDPKRQNISDKTLGLVFWIAPLCSVIAGILTYTTALGLRLNVNVFMQLALGLLFVVTGNFLPKCRQNYSVGIKTPWTLHDPENWSRTHRFAGRLWIGGGVLLILGAFAGSAWLMLAVLLTMAFLPLVYSYALYAKSRR